MRTTPWLLLITCVFTGWAHAGLDIELRGGALGNSIIIDLVGDPNETYLIFVSDDPNNLVKWSDITINTPGFIGKLDALGEKSATLPLPGAKVLDGFQLWFQAITVNGPPYVVDDSSPVCTIRLADKNGIVASGATLTTARTNAAAVELTSGLVLITGGGGGTVFSPTPVASADLYDPCSDTVAASSGTMSNERAFHTATLLQDGRVLVVGGVDAVLGVTTTADIYDPVTDQFTPTGALARARMGHTATLLDDGRVWIAGGTNALLPDYLAFLFGNTASTEIWDPSTGLFTLGSVIDSGTKAFHTATRLNDGKILFVGGYSWFNNFGYDIAEITSRSSLWDPLAGSWVFNPFRLGQARAGHSDVLLDDGSVLLAGGARQPVETSPTSNSVDRYDAVNDIISAASTMNRSRGLFPMFKLDNGRVVAIGGVIGDFLNIGATNRMEIYDPVADTWTDTVDVLATPRAAACGIPLSSGRFLVIGGSDASETAQLSAELFVQ